MQIAALYPLDTVKVVCQAGDCAPRAALAALIPAGTPAPAALAALYRGCGGAAVAAAAVGAVYLVSFEAARRAAAASSAPGAASRAATVGAVASSVATSLMEAPLELFRHRTQAGVGGSLGAQAAAALAADGVRGLYRGLPAFVLKSLPYDVAELVTYSALRPAARRADAAPSWLPPGAASAAVGALAGAAAVVASMPMDCIKTRLELLPPPGPGARASAAQFVGVAKGMAASGGHRAFFRGMAPRLAEKVPSSMMYWVTVEAVRRSLRPFVVAEPAPALAAA